MAISDTGREDLNGDPNTGGQNGFGGQGGFDGQNGGNPQQFDPPPFSPPPFDPSQSESQPFDAPQFDQAPFDQAPYQPEPFQQEQAPYVPSAVAPSIAPGTEFEQPPQLELGDDGVRLPWLEGDDEEFEDQGGAGIGQGLMLVVLGLVAIGVIVGGLFWVMRDKPDQALVADGGVIAAPKEPYKTRPDNPGGEVVAGTGDTSFAVAEGQARPPRIENGAGQGADAPKPGFETAGKPDAAPAAPAAAPAGGAGVQVGAYSNRESAEAGWNALKSQYPALAAVPHRVQQGQADIGTVYRLQAVPGSLAAAKALCKGMQDAGLSCQVKN